ncbi:anaerobic ribonucleoside-triphosphate reductase, partial [Vibrio anguillarum]|nr:anaerobic ribonucleoside-triphosphate reductase [Vibrio anguillarum]
STNNKLGEIISANVCEKMNGLVEINISEIQKLVEKELMHIDEDVARAYIEYRHDRDVQREKASALSAEISGLIEQSNADLLNENANKDSKVIPTQRDLLAGIISKHYAKHHILPRDIVQA